MFYIMRESIKGTSYCMAISVAVASRRTRVGSHNSHSNPALSVEVAMALLRPACGKKASFTVEILFFFGV